MPKRSTRNAVAKRLAEAHYTVEPVIAEIFQLLAPGEQDAQREDEPIKLLEVNPDTPPVGIVPIEFGPDFRADIPYPSIIVEVAPDEYRRLKQRKLKLPNRWRIGRKFQRPSPRELAAR